MEEADRQCMYNVTLWIVRATIVALEYEYITYSKSVCFWP